LSVQNSQINLRLARNNINTFLINKINIFFINGCPTLSFSLYFLFAMAAPEKLPVRGDVRLVHAHAYREVHL
jgi:hypothetical protein